MDYKESMKTLVWHSKHSKLGGAAFASLAFLVGEANYKTSVVKISGGDIAAAIGRTRQAVLKAIATLDDCGAITRIVIGAGRAATEYKIRSADDLNQLHMVEKRNSKYEEWYNLNDDLHGAHLYSIGDIEDEVLECEDCESHIKERCEMHQYRLNQLINSEAGRKMKVWLSDYPQPPSMVQTIFGRVL